MYFTYNKTVVKTEHKDHKKPHIICYQHSLRLGEKGTKQLFELFFAEMKNRGLKCSQGKLVDVTFQEAPRQRNTPEENKIIKETGKAPESWSEKKKAHKDIDATWTKKRDERHYGYKAHVMSNKKQKS